jgi:V/A-type H+-transporting ATPase subunit B
MNSGIGAGKTRDDHKAVSDQMYAGYAEGRDLRGLVAIVGKEALSERDQRILEFADLFEDRFVRQGRNEDRSIEDTLKLHGHCLSELPEALLTRVDNKFIDKYQPAHKKSN